MGVSVLGTFGLANNAVKQSTSPTAANSVVQSFEDYMKESPAQRMIDAWLKAHGLTEQALQKLPAAQREAIEKEMAQDIENQAKQKAESGLSTILAAD